MLAPRERPAPAHLPGVARLLTTLVLALCLAGAPLRAATEAAPGEVVEVATDLSGARAMARRALAIGRADIAESIARQILTQAPDDAGAHMILAAALTRGGRPEQAAAAARRGFRLAEGHEARFEGAWLTAEAMAAAGHPWRARFWLRRASDFSPGPAHEAAVARASGALAAQSRLGFGVQFFAGPSENVNGGSLHDTFWLWGVIPIPVEEALPGFVWGGVLSASYRITPQTTLGLSWAHREVALGRRARAIAPEARNSDYRRDELRLGLSHVWQSPSGQTALVLTGSGGWRRDGGRVSADLGAAGVELRRALAADWVASAHYSAEAVEVRANPVADSVTHRVGVSTSRLTESLGAFTLGLDAVVVDSDAAGIAWRGPSLSLRWRAPIPSDRLGLLVNLGLERRDYWRSAGFAPDRYATLSITAELPSLSVMGFNPTVTLSAERNRSQVVVRDTREVGVSFGIASRF